LGTLTFDLPDSVKENIEELAAREGFSVDQFLASAASLRMALRAGKIKSTLIWLDWRRGAAECGGFYLSALPTEALWEFQ